MLASRSEVRFRLVAATPLAWRVERREKLRARLDAGLGDQSAARGWLKRNGMVKSMRAGSRTPFATDATA